MSLEETKTDATEAPSQLMGFLKKRSPKKLLGKSTWQRRWFVLDAKNGVLRYFHNSRNKGEIKLAEIAVSLIFWSSNFWMY